MDVDMLAASLRRLKYAARGLGIADVARQAVEQIEAAAAVDRQLAMTASVDVTVTNVDKTLAGHFLPDACLTMCDGKVTLGWKRAGSNDEIFIGWPDLRAEIRDEIAHALPALADALTAILLGRVEALAALPGGGSPDA